jgi:hypothetical protein
MTVEALILLLLLSVVVAPAGVLWALGCSAPRLLGGK